MIEIGGPGMKEKEVRMIMVDAVEVEAQQTTVQYFIFTTPRLFPWRRGVRSSFVSPGTGRKRRRSTSPWDRDRYEPRPRYDDYGMFNISPSQRDLLNCRCLQTPIAEDIRLEGHTTPPDPLHKIHTRSTTQPL